MEPSRITLVAILATVLGLLVCFFGYRLLRFTLVVIGLALGAYLGSIISLTLSITGPVTIIVIVVLAIVCALLMSLLFKLGIFLLGAAGTVLLCRALLPATGGYHLLIIGLAGILGGILALFISRPVLCLLTAFIGSYSTITGIFALLKGYNLLNWRGSSSPVMALSWIGLGILGFLVQILPARKRKKNSVPDNE
ncbi:DUF4203 domain-containing protein [candidate division WOR-3 bacterium]|nr:DUF4203 domain-containing protein [candidate division WOR-3 bacterium]